MIINPKNLIGVDEFNQSFFDKIDQIEIDISNDIQFEEIVQGINITATKIKDFKFSSEKNSVEKKIFELRNNKFDIFENENDYILYKIENINQREPDLDDGETNNEILELVYQKNKFDYNRKLMEEIGDKNFTNEDFLDMSQGKIETLSLNSIRDNNKFDINSVEILYSLPINSFTLVNDVNNNIYLAKIKNFQNEKIDINDNKYKEYVKKENSNSKTTLLKSYDLFLNEKYNVIINQKTIERVKNFFQ